MKPQGHVTAVAEESSVLHGHSHQQALLGHVVPFAVWLAVIFATQFASSVIALPRAWHPWSYALKSVVCLLCLIWWRPWRYYQRFNLKDAPLALAAGGIVALLWILPETAWLQRVAPATQMFYHRWLIMMPGTLPDYFDPQIFPALPYQHIALAYSPAEAGWTLTIAKLLGSAGVIAVIEEFFFRGFFYRWLRQSDFLRVPLAKFDAGAFATVAVVFALEHDRWFMGLVAGLIYGWLVIRRGDIWGAVIAHSLTNLILGGYVIYSQQYGFW